MIIREDDKPNHLETMDQIQNSPKSEKNVEE